MARPLRRSENRFLRSLPPTLKDKDSQALKEAMGKADIRIEEEKKQAEKKLSAIITEVIEAKGTEKYDVAILEEA
ncbi:hypothetical protein EG327_000436 [Venturia inaequalis]|uniref:Uncharacterized protein n=1 Tax=Venturia inaequalis TaxID=5025 RepID=A0A8H3U9H8_VENIN|nr:hypothetical protein EG327_000436 [Venturia inaequalis]